MLAYALCTIFFEIDDGGAAIQESSTIVPESEAKECPFTHSLVRGNIATNDALLPHISASVNNSLHRYNHVYVFLTDIVFT